MPQEACSAELRDVLTKLAAAWCGAAPLEKRSGLGDILSSVGQSVNETPWMQHGLMGAGLGAGLGGLGTAVGNLGKEEDEKKSPWGGALSGGLAGAGIGVGGSLAAKHLGALGVKMPSLRGMFSEDPAAAADAAKPITFKHPTTGEDVTISSRALAANPDAAQRIRQLTAGPAVTDQILTRGAREAGSLIPGLGAFHQSWLHNALPFSSRAVPALGAFDALAHARNWGESLGTGGIRPLHSEDAAKYLREGARSDPAIQKLPGLQNALLNHTNEALPAGLFSGPNPNTSHVPGAPTGQPVSDALVHRLRNNDPVKSLFAPTVAKPTATPAMLSHERRTVGLGGTDHGTPVRESVRHALQPGAAGDLVSSGYKGLYGDKTTGTAPKLGKLFGLEYKRTLPRSLMMRIPAYAALPAAEYALKRLFQSRSNNDELSRLADLIAQPHK